jgi:flagellar export protein FliJ
MKRKSEEIDTLIRVQGWAVDEQRRLLGQMLGREQSLMDDRKRLDEELEREKQFATENPAVAGHGFAAYVERHGIRVADLEVLLEALRVEIEVQRDRLAQDYREQKVLEEVQKNWRRKEAAERARLEQAELDEIAQNMLRRA